MRDRSITIALGALLATMALTAPAYGQTQPLYRNYDENGVDLVQGDLALSFKEGSIGSGPAELSMMRFKGGGQSFSQWDRLFFEQTNPGGVLRTVIGMPDGSYEIFTGGSFTNTKANGGTLTHGDLSYTYTSPEGTTITFVQGQAYDGPSNFCDSELGGYPCYMLPKTITYADGRTITLGFFVRGPNVLPPTRKDFTWRLMNIQNSFGYSMFIGYQSSGPTFPPPSTWYIRSKVDFKRDGVTQGTVNYTYPTGAVDVSDFAGNIWRVTATSIRRPGEATPFFQANSALNVTSVTNNGVTTNYNRVVNGNTVTMTVTNPLSQQTVVVSDLAKSRPTSITDALSRTTSYQYDASGRMTRVTRPEGNYTQFTYDTRGNVTETRNVAKSGSGLADLVSTASFDATCANPVKCNKPNSTIDVRGNTTDFAYDATHGGVTSITLPAPTTGAVRPQTRYTYALQNGEYLLTGVSQCQTLASCANAADETKTSLTYDIYGNVTSTSSGDGTGTLTATQTMTYDSKGDLLTVDGPLAGTGDTSRFRYDAARRQVGAIAPDPDSAGALKHRAVRTTYDIAGRVTKQELGTVNSQSDPDWAAFASLEAVDVTYDSSGSRVATRKLSGGGTAFALTQSSYDALGRPDCSAVRMNTAIYGSLPASACTLGTQESFGPDRISQNVYDAAGQVTQLKVAVGTADVATERTLTYTNNGKLQTLKDAENNLTTYEYDGHDRLARTTFPVTTQGANASNPADNEQYAYDGYNLYTKKVRSGELIEYRYDALNRLTLKDSSVLAAITYDYDNLGRLKAANFSSGTNNLSFTYDALGRNLTQVGPQGTVGSQWDVAGRRTRLTYPGSGLFVDYDYLVTGEMTKIRENGATSGIGVLATFAYDDLRRRTSLTRGNTAVTSYGYDPVSRLASLTQNLTGSANDLTITNGTYNPAGQLISQTRSNDSYAWTGHGSGSTASVANGLNQLSSIGGIATTHDARGNLTTDPTTSKTYTYSIENLLLTSSGGTAITLTYDPAMRLYQHTAGAAIARFAYDGLNMIAEYDGLGSVQRRYVHGPGVDEPLVQYEGSGTTDRRWFHGDERGSIIASSDGSGNLITINRYDEFGKPQATNTGAFQYTGQMWLGGLGVHYYKARMYAPHLGRFLQTDPIGYASGPNLYIYVGKDPINLVDPFGLDEQCGQVTGSHLMRCGEDYYNALQDIGYDVEQFTVINYTVTDASLATGSTSGRIVIPGASMSSTLRSMLHDEDVRNQVAWAWVKSGATGPASGKNEYGFWVTREGRDFQAGTFIRGEGPEIEDWWRYRTPGASIWFHVHPFLPGEHPHVNSLSLSGNDFGIAAGTGTLVVAMSHRPSGSRLNFGWWEYDCRFGRC